MPRPPHGLLVLLTAAVLLALVPLSAGGASAAPPSYVALGDSYSSGVGTRSYIDDGTSCQRSVYAYPSLIAAARGYALNFRACSGATVADVTDNQLGAVSAATAYVTISVGGNDAGFSDVLTECAEPGWMSDCDGAIDHARAFISDTLPGRLATLYARIRSRAPEATVVVVGYPHLFMGEDCNALTWFSPSEEDRLNRTADLLDSVIGRAARAEGFSFANPVSRFLGHAVCDDPEWINGLSDPISESYHPNRDGQADGYTPLVSPLLTGAAVVVTPSVLRSAARHSDALAAQQRRFADRDRAITPETFTAPDPSGSRTR